MPSWVPSKEYTFQFFLVMFAIALTVPLMASSVYLVVRVAQSERSRLENVAHGASSRAADEIDDYITSKIALLRALGSLQGDSGNAVEEIRRQSAIVFGASGINFYITNPSGIGILAMSRPGERLVTGPVHPFFADIDIVESGADTVRISVPRLSKGGPAYTLHADIPTAELAAILARTKLSGPYYGWLIGRSGLILARTSPDEQSVGALVDSIGEIRKGAGSGTVLIGGDTIAFWRSMPGTNWTVVFGIKKAAMTQPLYRNILIIAVGAILMLTLGLLLAALASIQLRNSLFTLLGVAGAVGQGQVVEEIGTPLREANIVGRVLASASRQLHDREKELRRTNERLERKVLERTADLVADAELLDTTFQSIDQGIIHFDGSGAIRRANRRARELRISSDVGSMVEPAMAPKDGAPHLVEHRREDGTVIEIRTTRLQDGSVVCTYTDVTDRSRTAERLAEATHLAQKANEAKDAFFATMSHEIRTPLNGMLGYAELLLLDSTLSIRQRDYAMRINGAGAALYMVLGDLLDYAKIDAETLHIEPKPFAFLDLFSEAMSIVEPSALAKGLELHATMPVGFPNMLLGDKDRLRQVLLNLLNNAIKFTDAGHIWLIVEGVTVADDHYRMLIRVEDSGMGIPPGDQPHIFERFFQVESVRGRADSGAGLGLVICKQLVESMGGGISCESDGSSGTTFKVFLTLPKAERTEADQTRRVIKSAAWRPARILVAEDVEISRQLICEMLEALGHDVECVATGLEAVEAARRERFDLVLMDIFMPGLDGIAAMRLIRDLGGAEGGVPVFACTANVSPDKIAGYENAGFDGCLIKPLRLEDLSAIVEGVMQRTAPTGNARQGPAKASAEADSTAAFKRLLDPELVERNIHQFHAELRTLLEAEIASSNEAGDAADRAHRLQSYAIIFGMKSLLDGLRDLEMKRADRAGASDALDALKPHALAALHFLDRIKRSEDSS